MQGVLKDACLTLGVCVHTLFFDKLHVVFLGGGGYSFNQNINLSYFIYILAWIAVLSFVLLCLCFLKTL